MYRGFQKGLEVIHERYLRDQELAVIERYVESFPARVKAHHLLREQKERLVAEALREFAKAEQAVYEQYRQTCIRDLQLVLTMIAHVVITDDLVGFTDSLLWIQNVMRAVHKEAYAAKGYKLLQSAIAASLPAECVKVIEPYLNQAIEMVSLPV